MKISIVIVNYNVKYFLEQCLYSVEKALTNIDGEIIVVDNNSVDGSVAMIHNKFPGVKLIANTDNVGFSKANNHAIAMAQGTYVLLLNPDTVIAETTLSRCLDFMDQHPDAGALGPKMIDGKGNFLPESKRGLPTPEVAFYKISGLTKLFPHSKRFGRYYIGNTSADEVQKVDVLTGAFMLLRKNVLDTIGYLDEKFFMYGEDIDLSYRITKAGYANYYFPNTTIIHYKGESTRKGSLNYVLMFYKAMQIFAEKHFSGKSANLYVSVITAAIFLKAAISIMKRGVEEVIPVLLDCILGIAGFVLMTKWWAGYHFHQVNYYSKSFFETVEPVYVVAWIVVIGIFGGYRRPFRLLHSLRGVAIGSVCILVVYAVLPDAYRFSRALIFLQTAWMMLTVVGVRLLLSFMGKRKYRVESIKRQRIAIVGSEEECQRVTKLLTLSEVKTQEIIYVFPGSSIPSEFFSGIFEQLREIIGVYSLTEVIFCSADLSSHEIIRHMKLLGDTRINFKIASPESVSVIGSNSADSAGDLYVINVKTLHNKKKNS